MVQQPQSRDRIFSERLEEIKAFAFNNEVAIVFDDMIQRSVPLYNEMQQLVCGVGYRFATAGSSVYDLGCATGRSLLGLARSVDQSGVRIVGVDSSSAMLEQCRFNLELAGCAGRIELLQQQIAECSCPDASIILLNYTIQFVAPEERQAVLNRLYAQMRSGGVLMLSEKVRQSDARVNELIIDLHEQFKRLNGYSELEIAQKREALENVLVPFSIDENVALLRNSGFTTVELCFKLYNFATWLAFKD